MTTSTAIPGRDRWSAFLALRLGLRRHLRFRFIDSTGNARAFLDDPQTGKSHRLSPWQVKFLEMLDGETLLQKVVRELITRFPQSATRGSIKQFVEWMRSEDLIESENTGSLNSGTWGAPARNAPAIDPPKPVKIQASPSRIGYLLMNAAAVMVLGVGVWKLTSFSGSLLNFDSITLLKSPEKSGPGTVETQLIAVKASRAGVLTEVLVRNGDQVDAGDVVARIEDPEVLSALELLRRQLGECRIRRDIFYRQKKLVDCAHETKQIAQLSRLIGVHEADSVHVEMRAPVAGRIEAGFLCGHVGREVASGDVLLKVQVRNSEELLAGN